MKKLLIDETGYETEIPEDIFSHSGFSHDPLSIHALIPGTIVEIKVRKGEKVVKGDIILVLEAMKMYNDVEAEMDGRVAEIFVNEGDRIEKGALMVRMEPISS